MLEPPERTFRDVVWPGVFARLPTAFLRRMLGVQIFLPYYHIVGDHDVPHVKHLYRFRTVAEFRQDLEFLLTRFVPIDLTDVLDCIRQDRPFPARAFLLTFDDGFREIHDVIAPILRTKGVPATFLLTTAFIDNASLGHDAKISVLAEHLSTSAGPLEIREAKSRLEQYGLPTTDPGSALRSLVFSRDHLIDEIAHCVGLDFSTYLARVKPYLTSTQIEALLADGFRIGAHSIDHPFYGALPLAEQLRQTLESVRELKTRFGVDRGAFAFPYSDRGVAREFFERLEAAGEVELCFGTRGLLDDEQPGMLQRFSMERTSRPARWIVARQMARRSAKILGRKGVIRRPPRQAATEVATSVH